MSSAVRWQFALPWLLALIALLFVAQMVLSRLASSAIDSGGFRIKSTTTRRWRARSPVSMYSSGERPATRARRQASVWRTACASRSCAQSGSPSASR